MAAFAPTQESTPIRPFAPDDFRRERNKTVALPASISKHSTNTFRSPHPTQHSIKACNEEVYPGGIVTTPRRSSLFESQRQARTPASVTARQDLSTQGSSQSSLRDLQEEAEREWQALRDRRSSLGLLPSHMQSSLAKSAIMTRSESSQTLLQQSIEEQRSANRRGRGAKMDSTSSVGITPTASLSGYQILVSSRPSSRERDCHSGQPASDSLLYKAREASGHSPQMPPDRSSNDMIHRASSKLSMASSNFSSGGDSLKELLQNNGDDERMPLVNYEVYGGRMGSKRTAPLRSIIVHGQQPTTLARLETKNNLTSDEKMEQLKRSQKLDTVLGGEWRKVAEESWSRTVEGVAGSSSPSAGTFGKRLGLLRRQSDPLVLHYAASEEEKTRETSDVQTQERSQSNTVRRPSMARWKGLHLNRSRSSLNLRHDAVSGKSDTPLTRTIPPLDIHPKAAALLGLCVLPEPLSATQNSRSDQQEEVRRHTHDRLGASSSSVELLRDSDSLIERDIRLQYGTEDNVLSERSGDQAMEDTATSAHRTERRRRVKKISRWLGAAVPPHLVMPNPDLQQRTTSASGYNLDEAPPSPFADYMSGSPLLQSGGAEHVAGSSSRPLIKARAVVHAKLAKKANHSIISSQSEADYTRVVLSEQDRASNVKRNHKLTSVFGEAPPQDLLLGNTLSTSTAAVTSRQSGDWPRSRPLEPRRSSTSPQKRDRHRSFSPKTCSQQPLLHHSEFSDKEAASSDSADFHQISRQQYRASIESLEYLVEKDSPLLNELVTAFAKEEVKSRRSRGLKTISGSSSPVLAQDDIEMFTASVDSLEVDSNSFADDKSRIRELKIRRHQKLGRWFGEKINDENAFTIGEEVPSSSASQYSDVIMKQSSSTRMAPRSAGSAQRPHSLHHRQAFNKILNSFEGEVNEDDTLSEHEKQQLQQRLWRLQSLNPAQNDFS